ncbi:hypothetical protein HHK36_029697 [Tetracentron sinense]|uniref:Uncharacterized protein n=1 Tax=Tetracentron sinense TaxID=13715 RepID=A0A835D2V2_TETSI|nr:hypothetical protein HHK36_029697 [Tetracentron sinense]
MAALKKSYADIILNTAKEAAARIMVSERKALRFQQDLFAAREEGLNMLIRIKQMMDSKHCMMVVIRLLKFEEEFNVEQATPDAYKIAETDIASLSHRRRIEELEAQLLEAEDTVRNLRTELTRVQDELEKVKNNPVQPLDEQIANGDAAFQEDISQDNKLNTSDSILCPSLDSESGPIPMYDIKNRHMDERNTDDAAKIQIEPSIDYPMEKYYSGNPDLASIIMRSNEPELYRNGCTQRIRALERNVQDGKLPLTGQTDGQHSHIKNELIIREDDKGEGTCTVVSPKADNIAIVEKNPTEVKEAKQLDISCDQGSAIKFFHTPRRRRLARYRKTKATKSSCLPNQVMKACELSVLSNSKTHPYPVNNIESGDLPRIVEDEAQKYSESHLAPGSPLNTTGVDPQPGCVDGSESNTEVIKAGSVQNATNEDMVLVDDSALTRQKSEAAESSRFPTCKPNLETVDIPSMNSGSKDEKTSKTTTGAPTQVANDRLLKYTFKRKRKKEILSILDENTSLEKNTLKMTGDKQNGALEPQKSSLIIESSRHSRRLVQVARQVGEFSLSLLTTSQFSFLFRGKDGDSRVGCSLHPTIIKEVEVERESERKSLLQCIFGMCSLKKPNGLAATYQESSMEQVDVETWKVMEDLGKKKPSEKVTFYIRCRFS